MIRNDQSGRVAPPASRGIAAPRRGGSHLPAALTLLAVLLGGPAAAQTTAPAAGAAPADSAAPPKQARLASTRASWLSDRVPLQVGDLVTVVVDEQTAARERVSTVASGDRDLQARMNAGLSDDDIRLGPQKSFGTGMRAGSRDVGEAGRTGDLTAVLTARVTALESDGVFRIEGKKSVVVDGRTQDLSVTGLVRAEDVSAGRQVLSGRVADAVITYKGKKIGPRMGIAGKILSILWP